MLWYVAMTVAGSVAGCLALHYLGRKGGEALVRKRFTGEKVERAMAALQRHGVMAVLVPSLLPPPAPFKIFVLLAGVAGISAGASRDGDRHRPRRPLPRARHPGGASTATARWPTCARTARPSSLVAVGVLAVGFGAYLAVEQRRGPRKRPINRVS